MLQSLEIKNYAIIEHAHIEFDKGLNIITGETGAGKSILLGALGLTLGKRADSSVLNNANEKCIIEATFSVQNYKLEPFFEKEELDYELVAIIRREISKTGKSRAFINDTPVTLDVLKQLAEQLVNLHSQHETQEINQQQFQLSLVDFTAKNADLLSQYGDQYAVHKKLEKELNHLIVNSKRASEEAEYSSFLLKEIKDAQLEGLNLEEVEQELRALTNSEEIKSQLFSAVSLLDGEEGAVLTLLNQVFNHLSSISKYNSDYEKLANRINSSIIELEDVRNEVELLASNTELDEERIQELTDKVDSANKLLKKHFVGSIQELMEFKEELEEKAADSGSVEEKINSLQKKLATSAKELNNVAKEISTNRRNAIPTIEKQITETLHQVGMPSAVFKVVQTVNDKLTSTGIDTIEFLFNSNKGFEPQPLKKIASGGELSRVMLSIKSLLANASALPTLIFDEIDTGISGETAAKVAEVFLDISKNHQLISITHLPQIAAKANKHLFIYKKDVDNKTQTKIQSLNEEQHIRSVAKMLSGESVSEASLENAKELIGY